MRKLRLLEVSQQGHTASVQQIWDSNLGISNKQNWTSLPPSLHPSIHPGRFHGVCVDLKECGMCSLKRPRKHLCWAVDGCIHLVKILVPIDTQMTFQGTWQPRWGSSFFSLWSHSKPKAEQTLMVAFLPAHSWRRRSRYTAWTLGMTAQPLWRCWWAARLAEPASKTMR